MVVSISNLYTAISVLFCAVTFVALAQSPARADCGTSAFRSLATKVHSVEAIPTTPDNELMRPGMTEAKRPGERLGINWAILPCPDESPASNQALSALAALWQVVLEAQDQHGWVALVGADQTRDPSACASLRRAQERSHIAMDWAFMNADNVFSYNPKLKSAYFGDLAKNAEYPHIHTELLVAARNFGLALPPLQPAKLGWQLTYQMQMQTVQAHLPTGVHCGSDAPYARE